MIIGFTGFCCSGKDTVAEYISNKYGYVHYSLSDIIRKIMIDFNIDINDKKNVISFGIELRKKNGNDVLAKKVLEKITAVNNCCITSIRHPSEVIKLKKRDDFILVNIDSPIFLRFERMKNRGRPGDPLTFEKFIEFETMELHKDGPGQQLKRTADMADINFANDSNSMFILCDAIEKLFVKIYNFFELNNKKL
jgi:dephospho-CoA kinase